MKKHITTAVLAGALAVLPVVTFAAPPGGGKTPSTHASSTSGTHATHGVVKSVDDSTLVITRTGKTHGEMTLTVNSSTHREGEVGVGSPVSVRYRQEGKSYIATAISVQPPKQQAAHTPSSKPSKP